MTAILPDVEKLPSMDGEAACEMHILRVGSPPPCGRAATLRVRFHKCWTGLSCNQCRNAMCKQHQDQPGRVFTCTECGLRSTEIKKMIWAVPI